MDAPYLINGVPKISAFDTVEKICAHPNGISYALAFRYTKPVASPFPLPPPPFPFPLKGTEVDLNEAFTNGNQ